MITSKIKHQLEDIGLTKSEIKVYLALLELGPSTTGPIIDKSQTANSKIYAVLEKLINRGLVASFKQKGLNYYKATNPKQILHYLKEKEQKIKQQEEKVRNILPTLTQLFTQSSEEKEAVVFKGAKGVRTAFRELVDSLKSGEQVNIMGVYNFGEEFKRHAIYFQKIRSEKKIKGNFLINKNAKKIADTFAKYPPVEVRFMEEGFITPAIFLIYKNKVIINLADDMVFFTITSQRAADAFNAYFKHLWKKATKYINKK